MRRRAFQYMLEICFVSLRLMGDSEQLGRFYREMILIRSTSGSFDHIQLSRQKLLNMVCIFQRNASKIASRSDVQSGRSDVEYYDDRCKLIDIALYHRTIPYFKLQRDLVHLCMSMANDLEQFHRSLNIFPGFESDSVTEDLKILIHALKVM